jgi:hypothetical protein
MGITAGSWAAAKVALGGGVAPAGAAFARLMMGVAIKCWWRRWQGSDFRACR